MPDEISFLEWLEQPRQILLTSVFFVLLCWAVTKISRRRKGIRVRDPKQGHRWHHNDFLVKPTYCSVCETSFVRGSFCDTCWIFVHDECEEVANKKMACKLMSVPRWVDYVILIGYMKNSMPQSQDRHNSKHLP